MTRIVQGVIEYQQRIFGTQRTLFRRLGKGQQPLALFITCSDSRINPNLITQTDPGELFILRNAGNLVPPYGAAFNGEAATIEYAVAQLHVRDVILCGHAKCGAMHGLLEPQALAKLPQMAGWLSHAQPVAEQLNKLDRALSPEALMNLAIEHNVLLQMEHLRTHPTVAAGLKSNKLRLHGWVYDFETGAVVGYDPIQGHFVPLADTSAPPALGEPEAEPLSEPEQYI